MCCDDPLIKSRGNAILHNLVSVETDEELVLKQEIELTIESSTGLETRMHVR